MATRFVELNEAATMLGLTPEKLNEMRSNGEIHGYRDGASWKFKVEEVERVKGDMAGGPGGDDRIPFDDGLDETAKPDAADSLLVRDDATRSRGETSPSKVIGKTGSAPDAESDLKLAGDSDMAIAPDSALSLEGEGSELSLDAGSAKRGASAMDSDVALVPGVGTGSDVKLVADTGSDKSLKAPPGVSADVLGDSEIKLKSGSSGGTGALSGGSGTNKGLGSGLGSGDLDIALDSELALSEDDEMVLGGSGVGSDLTLNPAADSGINLSSPSDSGLSLEADSGISLQSPTDSGLSLEEEPVDMGGSSISALELPEDEAVELDTEPAQMKKDEEFLLSPSDEMFADESDSGSQVIALEDSAAFDQITEALPGSEAGLLADSAGLDHQLDALSGGVAAAPMVSPAMMGGGLPEAPYSLWNILGLASIIMFLSLTGILMSDIMRNMWGWEDGIDVATSISEGITGAFGMK